MATDAFLIDVIDDSGALSIKVTDRATGEISIIEVSGLNP
jgi:curli production assembly/transport component CsgF